MKHLHASLKWNRRPATVRAALDKLLSDRDPGDATFTEASRFRDQLARLARAHDLHHTQPRGHGELAALTTTKPDRVEILPLSNRGIPRRGGEKPYALDLTLPTHRLIDVHLPSGVEGIRGLRRGVQADIWADCIRTLAKAARQHDGPMIIVGDWNVNARRAWVRDHLERQFPGFELVATKRGTHGQRAIDFALVRGMDGTARAIPSPVSDHRAVVLNLKEEPVATSQNGWPVHTGASSLKSLDWVTGRVVSGDVHTIFDHLCERFNAEVEPIRRDWSWGYAYRAVRGRSSGYSNHASGTAIDLNAPKHPLGRRGTFSAAQVAAIQKILVDLDGAIRWGGNYSGRPDEMHFEINTSAAHLAAVARKITNPPTPKDWFDMATKKDIEQAVKENTLTLDDVRAVVREELTKQRQNIPGKDGENVPTNDDTISRRILRELADIKQSLTKEK